MMITTCASTATRQEAARQALVSRRKKQLLAIAFLVIFIAFGSSVAAQNISDADLIARVIKAKNK